MSDVRTGNGGTQSAGTSRQDAGAPAIPGMAPRGLVKDLANTADPFPADFPLPAVIGHVAWMMSQAVTHKHLFLADLEWAVLPPVGFGQFRLWMNGRAPVGYCAWARISEQVEDRMKAGGHRLAPQDWRSGDRLWLMETLVPVQLRDRLLAELKQEAFGGATVNTVMIGPDGKPAFVTW